MVIRRENMRIKRMAITASILTLGILLTACGSKNNTNYSNQSTNVNQHTDSFSKEYSSEEISSEADSSESMSSESTEAASESNNEANLQDKKYAESVNEAIQEYNDTHTYGTELNNEILNSDLIAQVNTAIAGYKVSIVGADVSEYEGIYDGILEMSDSNYVGTIYAYNEDNKAVAEITITNNMDGSAIYNDEVSSNTVLN